ncbi:MAG: hypothetical protein KDJ90_07410 [Nitratireductor sp.]|nr:hypothetical protein [Nitratireductor sp.]
MSAFDTAPEPGQLMPSGGFARPVRARKGELHAGFRPLGGVAAQFV